MQQKDYNKGGLYVFLFAMVFVMVFFVYITFIHQHTSPDYKKPAPASATTLAVSPEASPAAQPAGEPASGGDLWMPTPEVVGKGEALFQINCGVCHGPKGLGDGPGGKALVPPPRNMVEGKWKYGGSPFQIFNTISKGSPGTSMASFAHLSEADRWSLVHYVRSLTKNVVAGTDAEIKTYKEQKK
ncbi:MAG: cytochrome c [Bdellovibrionia bacterium]